MSSDHPDPTTTAHLIRWEVVETQHDRTRERNGMTNGEFVRRAYALAEAMDIQGWIDCFTPDGSSSTTRSR